MRVSGCVEQTGSGAVVVQCEYLDLVSRVSALSRAGRPDRCTPHTVSLNPSLCCRQGTADFLSQYTFDLSALLRKVDFSSELSS